MPDQAASWWEYGLWGMGGGAAVLAIEFWTLMRHQHGKLPVRFRRIWYWVGEFCRIVVGGLLAVVLGRASQVTLPLGAFTVGVAAPLILSRLGHYVPRMPESPHTDQEKKP